MDNVNIVNIVIECRDTNVNTVQMLLHILAYSTNVNMPFLIADNYNCTSDLQRKLNQ